MQENEKNAKLAVEPSANAFSVMMAAKPKQGQIENEETTKDQTTKDQTTKGQTTEGQDKKARTSLSESSESKIEVESSKLENLSFSRILTSKSKSADMAVTKDGAMTQQELLKSESPILKPKSKRGRKPKKQAEAEEITKTENQEPVKNHFAGLIPPNQDQPEEFETPMSKKAIPTKVSKKTVSKEIAETKGDSEPKVEGGKNAFSRLMMGPKSKMVGRQRPESENVSSKTSEEVEVVDDVEVVEVVDDVIVVTDDKEVKGSNAFSKLMGPKSKVTKEEPRSLPEPASSEKKENPKKKSKQVERLIAETEEAESSSNEFEQTPEVSRRSSVRIQKNLAEIVKKRESQMMMEVDDDDEEEERASSKRKRGPKPGKNHRQDTEEMIVDLQNSDDDDDIYIEKVVITPQKKAKAKLASIFVMGKKANAIKVVEDPARVAARQAFLHSAVPQTLRDQIATIKVRLNCIRHFHLKI